MHAGVLLAIAAFHDARAATPSADALAAYQDALRVEKERRESWLHAVERVESIEAMSGVAGELRSSLSAALATGVARTKAVRDGEKLALTLGETNVAALPALEKSSRTARSHLEAAFAFSRAGQRARARLAQEADRAAKRHAQQTEAVLALVSKVEETSGEWDARRRRADDASARLAAALKRVGGDATGLRDRAIAMAAPSDGRAVPSQLRGDLQAVASALDGLRAAIDEVAAELGRARFDLPPPFGAEDGGAHAALALPALAAAELDRQIEVRAGAFSRALRAACQAESACIAAADRDIAAADAEVHRASAASARGRKDTAGETAEVRRVAKEWAEMARRAEAEVARVATTSSAVDLARNKIERAAGTAVALADAARAEFEVARAAADAAHLAAFGSPRAREEPKMALPDRAPPDHGLSGAGAPAVKAHAYERLTRMGASKLPAYGAYSYVLFGQRASAAAASLRERYQVMLTAIVSTTPDVKTLAMEPSELNVFCIPSNSARPLAEDRFDLDEYDGGLALSLLAMAGNGNIVKPSILAALRRSPGPFILTTFAPLDRVRTDSPVLFADLSTFSPESLTMIVAAYKERLVTAPPAGEEEFEPSRLQWAIAYGALAGEDMKQVLARIKTLLGDWFGGGERESTLLSASTKPL